MEMIISALISAVSAILVSLIGNAAYHKSSMEKRKEIDLLQTYRLDQLEKNASRQDQVADRLTLLEKDREITAEKIRHTNQRVSDLEESCRRADAAGRSLFSRTFMK